MIMRSPLLLSAFVLLLSFPAHAESINDRIDAMGQYWQRVSTTSSIYMRGPKAQQMLHRDIARCVVELRELERLGVVKDAIPAYAEGLVLSEDETRLAGWDAPERDEQLFAEQSEYYDFEGCMLAKGWERTKYVPYDVAIRSRDDYLAAHAVYSKALKKKRVKETDYDGLNE
ncbi:MAG: hypothetical protein KDI90_08845 [Alphaproteobacteria bacterium]|nr:hypothetical protein [Alphaproteobacteria bacterium]MCB9975868.1 hypothetical protein [Rhodospirillales bacterium]